MKWFKHLVDSGGDPDIDDAISLFGAEGYYVFFRTLEIMSREFDYQNPGKNCFSAVFFRKKFRVSWQKVTKILRFFDGKGRIFFQFDNGNKLGEVRLYCPKLKGLCDEHTRRVLTKKSGVAQESLRQSDQTEAEAEAEADLYKSSCGMQKFDKEYLKSDEIAFASIKKIKELIKKIAGELIESKIFPDVDKFVGQMRKKSTNERAILHALIRCRIKENFNTTPRAYCARVIQIENGNYNERENRRA